MRYSSIQIVFNFDYFISTKADYIGKTLRKTQQLGRGLMVWIDYLIFNRQ